MNRIFLASTLGNDPHTEGLHNASKIAKLADIPSVLLKPSNDYELLLTNIKKNDPVFLGFSYRLSPTIGCNELIKVLYLLKKSGLLLGSNRQFRKIAFAGLPETIRLVEGRSRELPCDVFLIEPHPEAFDRIDSVIEYFDIQNHREEIRAKLKDTIEPPGIHELDQLADEVISNAQYMNEPPLDIPSPKAISNYVARINEAQRPIIRTHFGIPSSTIDPTVEGIKEIAESRVVDELSLGSSDLSQRYFGKPEMFARFKNDGGVPYSTFDDLVRLFQASRCGNFPSVKPYAHVVDLVPFIDACIRAGMLTGAHQAIPLFWFNELDGRGPSSVSDSILEHFYAVRELARRGIPVEMNDPNQWSSRWAHDTIIVADYGLISSIMTMLGVQNIVLQMQFNKPRETGDYADLAKMTAGLEIAKTLSGFVRPSPTIYRETRTGIESLSPNLEKAKWQLARSTLLQMYVNPHILHLVSYCEAHYAAKPNDIIEGSKIIRRAVKLFKENEKDLARHLSNPIVFERKSYLLDEAKYLLHAIAKLNKNYKQSAFNEITPYLANPEVVTKSLVKKYMTAPGIVNPKFINEILITRPSRYGFIDAADSETGSIVLTETERIGL